MVVWTTHDVAPPEDVKDRLRLALSVVADEEFGVGNWSYDDHMRNIPDHYHAHARPPYFWRRGQIR
jgi:hypothetical protein